MLLLISIAMVGIGFVTSANLTIAFQLRFGIPCAPRCQRKKNSNELERTHVIGVSFSSYQFVVYFFQENISKTRTTNNINPDNNQAADENIQVI
jgi:hypothetical protein